MRTEFISIGLSQSVAVLIRSAYAIFVRAMSGRIFTRNGMLIPKEETAVGSIMKGTIWLRLVSEPGKIADNPPAGLVFPLGNASQRHDGLHRQLCHWAVLVLSGQPNLPNLWCILFSDNGYEPSGCLRYDGTKQCVSGDPSRPQPAAIGTDRATETY